MDLIQNKQTPGPGTYGTPKGIDPKGAQFWSKYSSSGACNWNPPSSPRFARNILTDYIYIYIYVCVCVCEYISTK